MPETLFALDSRNYRDCQRLFRGDRNQEYYNGDYWVDDDRPVNVRAQKKTVGPYSIITTRAYATQYFRRTQKHIREDRTDISILWFVCKGTLVFCNQLGRKEVHPGQFLMTRSMAPFLIELQPEYSGTHEVLHVTTPTHLLREFLPGEIAASQLLPSPCAELAIAHRLLGDVFADEGNLAPDTSRLLVETAFRVVGGALTRQSEPAQPRLSVAERRREDVLRFIEVHLTDPDLCAVMVSRECGIGLRYLSLLLQETGQTFSEIVWSQRLEMARKRLATSDPAEVSISEIAYGAGFKSPAHFSRMFKRVCRQNPSDYRSAQLAERKREMHEMTENAAPPLQ